MGGRTQAQTGPRAVTLRAGTHRASESGRPPVSRHAVPTVHEGRLRAASLSVTRGPPGPRPQPVGQETRCGPAGTGASRRRRDRDTNVLEGLDRRSPTPTFSKQTRPVTGSVGRLEPPRSQPIPLESAGVAFLSVASALVVQLRRPVQAGVVSQCVQYRSVVRNFSISPIVGPVPVCTTIDHCRSSRGPFDFQPCAGLASRTAAPPFAGHRRSSLLSPLSFSRAYR